MVSDSIINKTPLSSTNRIIGGSAPSKYLAELEKGNPTIPAISRSVLNGYLASHMINPDLLRSDNFSGFMEDRQKRLLTMIEKATGKAAYSGPIEEENEIGETVEDIAEAQLSIATAR